MDNQNNLTQNNQGQAVQTSQGQTPQASPTAATHSLDEGYLVSQLSDPTKFSSEQVEGDLAAIKNAEIKPAEDNGEIIIEQIKSGRKSQELAALELANPFKGA